MPGQEKDKAAATAYEKLMARRRKEHRIKVKDLRVLRAVVPEDTPMLKALEEVPQYLCTCGERFDDEDEAHVHAATARGAEGFRKYRIHLYATVEATNIADARDMAAEIKERVGPEADTYTVERV